MDDLDSRILRILKSNAREPFVSIARRVGTSEATVRSRMKRLVESGVIRRFTIETGGESVRALVEVEVETGVNTAALAEKISTGEGVVRVLEVTGECDLVVFVEAPTPELLNETIDRIREFKEVRSTSSRLILKEHEGGS